MVLFSAGIDVVAMLMFSHEPSYNLHYDYGHLIRSVTGDFNSLEMYLNIEREHISSLKHNTPVLSCHFKGQATEEGHKTAAKNDLLYFSNQEPRLLIKLKDKSKLGWWLWMLLLTLLLL